jgi:hypothetical protein
LMPYIPGTYMQSIGTQYMRFTTCLIPQHLPRILPTQRRCWEGDDNKDILVLASAAKSGAVLAAKIALEIGRCGVCVASPERSRAGIPGPIEDLPVYSGRLLLAIVNMLNWPEYVYQQGYDIESLTSSSKRGHEGRVRCVTLLREPMARLRSLYTYSRTGGEHWFRYESGVMSKLNDKNMTLQQSLDMYWNSYGREYLEQSHNYTMLNLRLGCTGVKMESFHSDFAGTLKKVFESFGILESVHEDMISSLSNADSSKMSDSRKAVNPHLTSIKFSKFFIDEVNEILLAMPEISSMIETQKRELGYA